MMGEGRKMGRGKIEIKMIENTTNRQVTYSKRRGGLFKKAKELTVLCDAQVCLLMVSSTNKFSEYSSPSTNTKDIFERYQQATRTDIWEEHYNKMQKELAQLKDTNTRLHREISQRMGDDLDDLDIKQLRDLEQDIEDSLTTVRARKEKQITSQTETFKKKVKSSEIQHHMLLQRLNEVEGRFYGYVNGAANEYGSLMDLAGNEAAHQPYNFRVQPGQPNLQTGGYDFHELRLS
ncbi:MADS-box transcription factor 16-like isoform X2 [Wolffia australiana]